jgi:hypothetical protein
MYYYDEQLKAYMIQFMAIFSGLQVKVGKSETEDERLISVPIYYGNRDRVVAHILGDNTQNKPIRLPTMSAYMSRLDMAPERRRGVNVSRRKTYLPLGGLIPDDIKTVSQYMPRPYWVNMELQIYASNTDQHNQILEQILVLFDPTLEIQKNDAPFDWTRISSVELTGIRNESNYPSGSNNRIIQTGLDFKFIAELEVPAEVRDQYVNEIFIRIGKLTEAAASKDPYNIVQMLDEQGINYESLVNGKDIKIT